MCPDEISSRHPVLRSRREGCRCREAPALLQVFVWNDEGKIYLVDDTDDDAQWLWKVDESGRRKASVLLEVCGSLLDGDVEQAGQILDSEYPFERIGRKRRT